MQANVMDDRGTDAMKTHFEGCDDLMMRQTRRGCFQECLGCEALVEFKYYKGSEQVFYSLEDTDCCCRVFCTCVHPYKTVITEVNTKSEIITLDRPLRCCMSGCKCCPCCTFQEATISSGGQELGSIKENFYICVPSMKVYDHAGAEVYHISPPTCCGGICINCCAEGNPCGKGCCKESFRIYAPGEADASTDAPYLGVFLKMPKSKVVEVFTDAVALDVKFPKDATPSQKGLITGLGLFINSIFYEGDRE